MPKEEAAANVIQAAQVLEHNLRQAVKLGLRVSIYSNDSDLVTARVYERQETTFAEHPPPKKGKR